MSTTEGFNREGEPMRPLGYIGDGPDFEVYRWGQNDHGKTGWRWQAYSRDQLLDSGDARTRFGLAVALWRARRRLRRQIERGTR
jgi:hypothetical protein